jgi:galactose-1-phosphate uridylyltransferase
MSDAEPKAIREIRINPIVPSESVLVATARGMRPRKAEDPAPRDTRKHVDTCPFCTGNEHMTPPTIAAYPGGRLAVRASWRISIRCWATTAPPATWCSACSRRSTATAATRSWSTIASTASPCTR